MNISDAAYKMAHEYPGGATALAARMGISKHVLNNKLNPHQQSHKLSLQEAEALSILTDDDRILRAFAQSMGQVCFRMEIDYSATGNKELFRSLSEMMSELGRFAETLRSSLNDHRISREEMNALSDHIHQLRTVEQEILNRVSVAYEGGLYVD